MVDTHYCVMTDAGNIIFRGSLNECSTEIKTVLPGEWLTICKIAPVSVHGGPKLDKSFPARPTLSM